MANAAKEFRELGAGHVDELVCDLSDLASVRACAAKTLALPADVSIDVLLLNAGMTSMKHQTTASGTDLLMTANHLGHFLLTGSIFGRLAADARVIAVSSLSHQVGEAIPWADVGAGKKLKDSYGYSKAANLLFVDELNRRLLEKGSSVIAVGAHRGLSTTEFVAKSGQGLQKKVLSFLMNNVGQPAAHGAWPLLMAATDPERTRECYYAPSKKNPLISREFSGPPMRNGVKGKNITPEAAAIC